MASKAPICPAALAAEREGCQHLARRPPLVCQRGIRCVVGLRQRHLQLLRRWRRLGLPLCRQPRQGAALTARIPHQKGVFYGNFDEMFEQLHGKEISYNNLLDIDAAVSLISEFDETTFAILKHNNACGLASRDTLLEAWKDALAGDPRIGFRRCAHHQPSRSTRLRPRRCTKSSSRCASLRLTTPRPSPFWSRRKTASCSCRNPSRLLPVSSARCSTACWYKTATSIARNPEELRQVTDKSVTPAEVEDLLFANKIVKHSKSNAIVLAKNRQLCASGYRSDLACRRPASGHREGPFVPLRFAGSRDGIRCPSSPFADCVEIAPRGRGKCRDTTGRFDSRQRVGPTIATRTAWLW